MVCEQGGPIGVLQIRAPAPFDFWINAPGGGQPNRNVNATIGGVPFNPTIEAVSLEDVAQIPARVPTLSSWAMAILVLLLVGMGIRMAQKKEMPGSRAPPGA